MSKSKIVEATWDLFWVVAWLIFLGLYLIFVPEDFYLDLHVWFLIISWYALGVFHGRGSFD